MYTYIYIYITYIIIYIYTDIYHIVMSHIYPNFIASDRMARLRGTTWVTAGSLFGSVGGNGTSAPNGAPTRQMSGLGGDTEGIG